MDKYKILFIDEERDSFDDFLDYVEKSPRAGEIEPLTQLPLEDLDSMIEKIIDISPDAIITDFNLNEKRVDIDYNVPYNGTELLETFLSIRDGFPFIVLTAFDDIAVNQADDVNKVYVKNILHKSNKEEMTKAKATFLDRVIASINHYQAKLKNAEEELVQLLEKKKAGKTNYDEEQRIIELDGFIEKSVDKGSSIPNEYKLSSNTDRLGELLSRVDNMINKLNKDGNDN
ncbi:hypothetical protein G6R40_12095 [Chryseobacterium sp. POL2]|uniref:hypothetical protein n=1 Tax=Chryseobacterium sp. POL2 TaxID=2713414 RepID=UPI0013E143B1|nr:hypothetical protein [Chryseobacterium sp. POL2]QIG90351.1 hypothetical protein G6R40_12095 [Chryseobacterium sp. POL2]